LAREGSLRHKLATVLPFAAFRPAFALYSRITFNALSRRATPVLFQQGDVLFLCDASWTYDVWAAVRLAREAGAQIVVMVHDLIPIRNPEFGTHLVTATFHRWIEQAVRSADALVCNSSSTMRDLQAYARERGWSLPRVGHFRRGCDLPRPSGRAGVRPELARIMGSSAPCFAAVGTFETRKNYPLLLEAFEQLWAQGEDLRLVLMGRVSSESTALARALAAHPEGGRRLLVLFDATDAEVAHAYANARALVFPSLAEGFGLPLVEARTRGALVIASDIPAFRELADDGVLIFDRRSSAQLRDRVLEVADMPAADLTPAMPAFTWSDSTRQLVAVMSGLLSGST
jgi:alpha-1,2-rhamnosyltransferase